MTSRTIFRLLSRVLTLLTLCFHTPLFAQGWVNLLTEEAATEIVSSPGQGCFMGVTVNPNSNTDRRAYVVRFDTAGNQVWKNEFLPFGSVEDLALTADGGVTALAFNMAITQSQLYHFGPDGALLWTKDLGNWYHLEAHLEAYPGGGYLADLIYRENLLVPPTKLGLHRFDADGNLLWRTQIDTLALSNNLLLHKGLGVNGAGESILAYRTGTLTMPQYRLGGYTAAGNAAWQLNALPVTSAGALADGNFIYIFQPQQGADFLLRKVSPTGTVLWETTYNQLSFNVVPGIFLPAANGGFSVGGTGIGQNGKTIRMVTFDAQGQEVKNIDRPLPGFDDNNITVLSIAAAEDGGFYVNGLVQIQQNLEVKVFLLRMDADGNIYPKRIRGTVAYDADTDCLIDAGETRLEGHTVRIEDLLAGIEFFASTDSAGVFLGEADSSEFRVSPVLLNPYWQSCVVDTVATFEPGSDTLTLDFPLQKVVECPFLEVDIATWGLRRCFDNTYAVRYCNTGTADAAGVYIDVKLDPYLEFVSATIPATALGGNTWRFPVGSVVVGDCGAFNIVTHLDCDSTVLGQTHCVEAHIYPDSFCLQNGAWSGANVDVDGNCHPDSVRFVIRNIGTGGNANPLEYVIIEDNIIFLQGTFQLPAGDSLVVQVPANGSTWRLEAEQEPFAPGDPMPSYTVEGCGENSQGAFSIGFVSQFNENDGNPYVSADCQENRGSFDPNDKQGFPRGVGDDHLVEPGIELEYLIRFQNTGTDTAFRVVVRDTLDTWLDPATLRSGASSHPYRFNLAGTGVAVWTFDPIALPDSNVNEPGSHGFIKFRIAMRPDVPLGAQLTNRAGIYFDFNEPVITNTVVHTVGRDFLSAQPPQGPGAALELHISPNPAAASTIVELPQGAVQQGRLQVYDARGRLVQEHAFNGQRCTLPTAQLPSGLYFLRAFDGVRWIASGKVVVEGGR